MSWLTPRAGSGLVNLALHLSIFLFLYLGFFSKMSNQDLDNIDQAIEEGGINGQEGEANAKEALHLRGLY